MKDMSEQKIKWIGRIVFVVALAMIGIGIARGEASVVLTKAISICMQCIGIG